MNLFALIPLTAALVNLALTIFVFSRGPRFKLNRVYLIWGLGLTVWNTGVYFMFFSCTSDQALFWARFVQFGVILLPVSLYHLSLLIARVNLRWRHFLAFYSATLVCLVADLTGHFVSDVRYVDYSYYAVAGPVFWIFPVIYVGAAVSILRTLYRRLASVSPLHQTRLRWMMGATIILIIFGMNDVLPILGVDTYPLIGGRIYPLGSLAAIFYGLIVAYSVLQYQLLDIHVKLSRFSAQFVRLGFMSLVGFLLLLVVAQLAPAKQFGFYEFFGSLGVLILTAVLASFFFPQFFGKGDEELERRILGDHFEYHDRVLNLIQKMRTSSDSQLVMEQLEDVLVNTIEVRNYHIILLDETTRGFSNFQSYPPKPKEPLPGFQVGSPVFKYFQSTQARYLFCDAANELVRETELEHAARAQLQPFDASLCLPFFSNKELLGLFLLGAKKSSDLYTPHDLRLLNDLTYNLGLILAQIRLQNQLQIAHEQDLLGRMSRGLAHDLNNLLTPVQTLLQLLQESHLNQETINELLPMALNNLSTVRTYVNEALFFSRSSALQSRPESLVTAVREALALSQAAAAAKNVQILFPYNGDVVIEMDVILIKRLICNLLSNAVDASPSGAQIDIVLSMLPKTELSRDWYRLQIIDHGEGMSPETLKRAFTPYFTTKNTGDGKRGFGLGLAIAHKIVHLHGGNLSIASREKKGTTVQVDLPGNLIPQSLSSKRPVHEPVGPPIA